MASGRGSFSSDDSATSDRKDQQGVPIARHLVDQSIPQVSSSELDIFDSLSLTDTDTGESSVEQSQRPRVVLSEDTDEEHVVALFGVETSSVVRVQRPRAVLSSPENDEMLSELQGQPKKVSNVHPPKAPLSPLEELYGNVNGVPCQLPIAVPSSPGSTLENFQGTKAAATPSKQSVADQTLISENQAETKGKSSSLVGMDTKHELALGKLDGEGVNVLHTKGSKNQTVKKKIVSTLAAAKTNSKKDIHVVTDVNRKARRNSGSQGVRPWY